MSCNGCFSSFSLLRPEKGCPNCGFSYCRKCLGNKAYLSKQKAEVKVCNKCYKAITDDSSSKKEHTPPDAFLKRVENPIDPASIATRSVNQSNSTVDDQMRERLNKLKEKDSTDSVKRATDEEIADRLQKIKGDIPVTSDTELHARLAKLRGMPAIETKPVLVTKDLRTEQEQVEDLMKQYLENTAIDCKYKDEFNSVINDMEGRLQRLKNANGNAAEALVPVASGSQSAPTNVPQESGSEDEEESVNKIIQKLKVEALIEEAEEIGPSTNDELPFCEICNEDANMRCLGCRYLFCKRCFLDHRDDDDGCDKYEPYQPPKGSKYS